MNTANEMEIEYCEIMTVVYIFAQCDDRKYRLFGKMPEGKYVDYACAQKYFPRINTSTWRTKHELRSLVDSKYKELLEAVIAELEMINL